MQGNQGPRRLIQLAVSVGITLAMITVFVAVGGIAPTVGGLAAFAKDQGVSECARPEGDTRPGYGHGDKNHTHIGPPGQVCRTETRTETETLTETEIDTETKTNTKIKKIDDDDEDEDEDKDKDKDEGGQDNRRGGQGQRGGGEGRRGGR